MREPDHFIRNMSLLIMVGLVSMLVIAKCSYHPTHIQYPEHGYEGGSKP